MQDEQSKKPLGFWMLTALLIGNVVGSGIFLLPATLAKIGSISLLGWVITSAGALCIALVFAELSRAFPKSGGLYVFCREAFGDFVGFQNAFLYWIAMWVGNAALIVAFISYLSFFWPALDHNGPLAFVVGSLVLWLLTLVNIRGVKNGAILQTVMTILKLIPFIAMMGVGVFYMKPHYLTAFNVSGFSSTHAVFSAVILTLWAFLGIETATVPAGEVDHPEKNIPKSVILGTITIAIIYLSITVIVMCLLPMASLANSPSPISDAATVVFGRVGGAFIGLGAVIAIFGTINGFILVTGQTALAAAQDGFLPSVFAKKSKHDSPAVALIVSGVLANLLLLVTLGHELVSVFTFIISFAILINIIPYFYACLAYLRLVKREVIRFSRKKTMAYTGVTLLALVFVSFAILETEKIILVIAAAVLLASYPLYLWTRKVKN